jgi:hypothetical protein
MLDISNEFNVRVYQPKPPEGALCGSTFFIKNIEALKYFLENEKIQKGNK